MAADRNTNFPYEMDYLMSQKYLVNGFRIDWFYRVAYLLLHLLKQKKVYATILNICIIQIWQPLMIFENS